jgi:hypothetical protein
MQDNTPDSTWAADPFLTDATGLPEAGWAVFDMPHVFTAASTALILKT